MSNEAKVAIVFGTFLIIAGIFSVVMAVKFSEVSSLVGIPVGMVLAISFFCWYYAWKN